MRQIIFCETAEIGPHQLKTEDLGIQADGAVCRGRKSMPEGRLNQTLGKQLTNPFETFQRFSQGLAWQTIHQIGMHQNPRLTAGLNDSNRLVNRDAFFDQIQKTITGSLKSRAQCNTA